MKLQATWNYPTSISVGDGCVAQLGELCKQLNMTKVLLVTDPGLADLTMIKDAVECCSKVDLHCEVFSQIQGNPTGANVRLGVDVCNKGDFDGVIAFGGGSSMDAAKAIALMAKQSISMWDVEDIGDNWTRVQADKMLPVVAVPTTAGTGSEVGRSSVITDSDGESHVKRIIFHPGMLPEQVLLDPQLTVNLPAHITAATGLDALAHNLEAYCAPYYHPMAEGIAIEAIRLIKDNLPLAVKDGTDIQARTQMLVASCMGATSFQRGLGAMHALAHSLGALYNKHHGLLNAILMPYVLQRNKEKIEARIIRLARYLELEDPSFEGFLEWILQLRTELSIPHSLSEIGITLDELELVGKMSVNDLTAASNPIQLTAEQYSQLFACAVQGHLEQVK